jgi:hypothetical protein
VLTPVQIVSRVLLNNRSYTGTVANSPYFVGIISASMIWVGYAWVSRLLQCTFQVPLSGAGG